MNSTTPVAASERISLLDALRGFAVFGIFVANMLHFSGYFFLSADARAALPFSAGDHILEFLIGVFVDGKFYSIFSLLFGIGFAVLLTRCDAAGRPVTSFFRRRLTVLLVIGLIHAYGIWYGDILTLYALTGFALLAFRDAKDRTLLAGAAILFALPVVQYAILMWLRGPRPVDPAAAAQQAEFFALLIRTFAEGSIGEAMRLNVGGVLFGRYPDLLFTGRIFKVLATFLLGLYIGRHGVLAHASEWRGLLRRVCIVGFAVGLPANVVLALLAPGDTFERLTLPGLAESAVYAIGVPSLALAYVAGFALLYVRASTRFALLEPVGRMALTNYLLQSICGTAIFKTVGFGLMGEVSVTVGTLLVITIFPLQIIVSRWWLERFRFGPAEWLWRSLTYAKLQPMRRAHVAAAGAV